ncbi:melatonin receptor type 1A [Nematostella vectensis]|uniref:melatonin receptor type 1A n=1 Tax=Nematostella vectensis TaxID=45351 RepID=UPI002077658D|nr:melatonin receptor type 1A [Nematostella vectensis]
MSAITENSTSQIESPKYGEKYRLELANRGQAIVIQETATSAVISSIAIVGNFLVLLAVYRNPNLRKTQVLYVSALAVADMSMNVVLGPPAAYGLAMGNEDFGKVPCVIIAILGCTSGTYTYLIICLMAVQRYSTMLNTRLHSTLFTRRKVKISIAITATGTLTFIVITGILSDVQFHPGFACCLAHYEKVDKVPVWVMLSLISIPALISHFCYIRIWRYLRQHREQMAQSAISAAEVKTSRIFLLVINSFSICLAPFMIVTFIEIFTGTMYTVPRQVYLATTNLAGFSSCINPIIYAALSRPFQQEFGKMFVCKRRRNNAVAPV